MLGVWLGLVLGLELGVGLRLGVGFYVRGLVIFGWFEG